MMKEAWRIRPLLLVQVITVISSSSALSGPIRLVGGVPGRSGRLEIFHENHWGTVCDDGFGSNEASTVCRQLGVPEGGVAYSFAYFGQGSGPIWADDVNCPTGATNLTECLFPGWGVHNCGHYADVGVICDPQVFEGPIRLADGVRGRSGRLEIFHDNEWGTVCDRRFGQTEASLVCRMLGLTAVAVPIYDATFGEGNGTIWADHIECPSGSSNLSQCSFPGWGVHNCTHGNDVGVSCQVLEGPIRLVGGVPGRSGRLEIFHDNEWGTVCGPYFGSNEASIVCRQLGIPEGGVAYNRAHFGQGSGLIWTSDVNCPTGATNLTECSFSGWATYRYRCRHSHDAGVICDPQVFEGPIRLVDGVPGRSGRLEIFHDNEWGTVCDRRFGQTEASLVCRRLVHTYGGVPIYDATFGEGNGTIWAEHIECPYGSSNLSQCHFAGWGVHNCTHGNDVGVICQVLEEEDHCGEVMNVCDHVCIPNDVNYTCSCHDGYVLEADGVTCRDPCPRGTFVTGDTCVPCPHGHYQQYREKPQCHVCAHGYNTSDRGASSESHCRTVCDLAFGRCQNGGRCVTQDRLVSCDCGKTGFTGRTCATDIDECLTRPCYNGGQCTNTRGGYECVCPTVGSSQYAGANCTDVVTVSRTPVTSSTSPQRGPLAGGTKITIHGEHFDTGFKPIRVNVAKRYKCPIRESNDTYFVATTPRGDDSDVGVPLPIEVVFEGGLTIFTGTSFEYRANPEITALYPNSTLLEGGSTITVTGNRLTSVSTPFLEMTAELTEIIRETYNVITKTTKELYQEKCSVLSDELAECRTPEIGLRERYNASDDQSTLSLYIGFVLDGFDEYRNLENTSLESSRQLGYIGGYTITPLTEAFVYNGEPLVLSVSSASRTKRSSPKKNTLAPGEDSEYSVLIGQGECQILDRGENSLHCEVPSRVPAKLPHSTSEHHTITLTILQTVNYTMGYLQYPNNLGIVIGVPVAAAAILVIAIITAVVVVEKRRRRNKDRRETQSPPNMDDWVVLPALPSDRSLDGSMHSEKDVDKRERERVIRLQRDRRGRTRPSGQGLRDNWLLYSSNRNHTH